MSGIAQHAPEEPQARPTGGAGLRNEQVAERLRLAADILAAQGADPFRIAAYRRAAASVLELDRDLGIILDEGGRVALETIPGVISLSRVVHPK